MSQQSLSTLVCGYIEQFQHTNKLFHHFDVVLINLCTSYCRTQLTANDINFERIKKIGRGAFGCIYEIKKKDTGKTYAMKQYHKQKILSTKSVEKVISERNILVTLESKFIVSLKYAFTDNKSCYLILDLMKGADLKYYLQQEDTFTEERTKFYAAEILLGLEHIHSKGIIFRDLKLENMLLDMNGHCQISDFGLSIQTNNEMVRGYAGTPGYVAPEAILGWYYNKLIDYFSFGVLVYRCLCGSKPFWPRRKRDKKNKTRKKSSTLDRHSIETEPTFNPKFFGAYARSFIKGLLCKNSKCRLGCNGIMDIKQHPWFDSIDFDTVNCGHVAAPIIPDIDEIDIMMRRYNIFQTDDDDSENVNLKPEIAKKFIDFDFDGVSFKCKSDWYKPGNIVQIINLKQTNEFNDEIAEIVGYFLEDTERWPVKIITTDKKLAIKTENLRLVSVSLNMRYNYDEKINLNDCTQFEKEISYVLVKWIKCIKFMTSNDVQCELYGDNQYDYIVDNHCIKLIELFLGKYLTIYDEVFRRFDMCTDSDNLHSIKYMSCEWTLYLYIDNKCEYQGNDGIWHIEGDQLFIEYGNSVNEAITEKFDVWRLIDAEKSFFRYKHSKKTKGTFKKTFGGPLCRDQGLEKNTKNVDSAIAIFFEHFVK